jgi:acyl-coenzyme A thioesterase PaaI-like protein
MGSDEPNATSDAPTGADLARAWFEHSPFARQLDLELVALEPSRATVRLPHAQTLATAGDVVHGGAISSLIDTAAALAAWSDHDPAEEARWAPFP